MKAVHVMATNIEEGDVVVDEIGFNQPVLVLEVTHENAWTSMLVKLENGSVHRTTVASTGLYLVPTDEHRRSFLTNLGKVNE